MSCYCGDSLAFKRGATFRALCEYTPPEGGNPNLIGATIMSHVAQNGRLIQPLNVTLAPDGMSFTLTADETDTATWPVATLQWDIRIELEGEVAYTETIELQVLYAVTKEIA